MSLHFIAKKMYSLEHTEIIKHHGILKFAIHWLTQIIIAPQVQTDLVGI